VLRKASCWGSHAHSGCRQPMRSCKTRAMLGVKMELSNLRFGVIGWGYWGPKIARNLNSLPYATVTMVADQDARRLVAAAVNQSWVQTTTRPEEVFGSQVDGVIIATPVRTHYQLAKQALLQEKHVLVEKPLTADVGEAEELVALAQEQRRVLMVGHTFEYNPAVNELRKLLQQGELGKIYCIEAERVNLGLFRNDINVIWDLAPHDVSILLYLLGKGPEQIRVRAHAHIQSHIHDVAHLDLDFAGGMTAHIHVSWLHPCKIRRVTVIGDARMVVYDDTNPAEMLKIYNKGADVHADPMVSYRFGEITIPHIDWIEPLRLECEDFTNAIRTGAQPRAHGGVGLEVVRVLAATQKALEKREWESAAITPAAFMR
jgi:predicted dehydrogenase